MTFIFQAFEDLSKLMVKVNNFIFFYFIHNKFLLFFNCFWIYLFVHLVLFHTHVLKSQKLNDLHINFSWIHEFCGITG